MKNENYYIIYGWMVNEMNLDSYGINVFAFLYGFQEGFTGTIQYIADSTGMCKRKAYDVLCDLIEKGYIKKEGKERQKCKYSVVYHTTGCCTVNNKTVAQYAPNNNIHKSNYKKGTFTDFNQRVYNFSELEKLIRSN